MDTLRSYLGTLTPIDQAAFAVRSGTSIGYLRKALSVGQRFDGALVRLLHIESGGAVSLTELRPDIWPAGEASMPPIRQQIGSLVDSRMSKRALRTKFGFMTDAHLAKVLQLPVAEVEAWPEERGVPALPQVLQLLGVQAEYGFAHEVPSDPDADRVIQVQVA